jgi:hypothetical protein
VSCRRVICLFPCVSSFFPAFSSPPRRVRDAVRSTPRRRSSHLKSEPKRSPRAHSRLIVRRHGAAAGGGYSLHRFVTGAIATAPVAGCSGHAPCRSHFTWYQTNSSRRCCRPNTGIAAETLTVVRLGHDDDTGRIILQRS